MTYVIHSKASADEHDRDTKDHHHEGYDLVSRVPPAPGELEVASGGEDEGQRYGGEAALRTVGRGESKTTECMHQLTIIL